MKKVVVVLIMMIALTGVLWGNGQQDSETVHLGMISYDLANKFHTYIQDGVKHFAESKDDVFVTYTDGQADANKQLNQVETLLTKGVDAIILTPVDPSFMPAVIKKCDENGVFLVVVNILPNEKDLENIDCYIGSESIDAGTMQAEAVAELLDGSGNVGILIGDLSLEVARMRTEGNKQVFSEYENINVLREAEGKWDRAQGMRIVENWLQADVNNELDAIVANNDEMAIGAILAAQGVEREGLVIAGIDATPDALEFLGEGLNVTIFQSGNGQGFGAAEAAYNLVAGKTVEKFIWIPYEVVTPELKTEYQARWK